MAKTAKIEMITIPPINVNNINMKIVGLTPLITHAWSQKAKAAMLAKQQRKATAGKEAKDPVADFADSLYWLSERPKTLSKETIAQGRFGFPCVALKSAIVDAASSIKTVTKVLLRQAIHITGEGPEQLIEINGRPEMREDSVRVGMGTADLRYRAMFMPWSATANISFNADVLSAEQIAHLLSAAGFGVGLCEWRPQKGGPYGRFSVA